MIRLIGLRVGKNEEELRAEVNAYIKKSDKTYLIESLVELVSDEYISKIEKLDLNNSSSLIGKNNKLDINFIFYGNVMQDYNLSKRLLKIIKLNKVEFEVIKSESLLSLAYEKINYYEDLKIVYAEELECIEKDRELIVHGIATKKIAKGLIDSINKLYKKDLDVIYFDDFYAPPKNIKVSQLYKEELSLSSLVYIKKEKKGFSDLLNIIRVLRAPSGCPWDKEQNHKSLKRELVEECYEVLDAIDNEDINAMQEEIGDVLLHVVFHSLIAQENDEFDIVDVANGICEKMIFRHPHIFGGEIAKTSQDVIESWDDIKKEEKGYNTIADEINGIAKGLPSLIRAKKVQKKAAKIGFDFDGVEEAVKCLEGEIKEFKDVYKSKNMTRIKDELGDVLFSTVNVGRLLKLDCEEVLEKSTEKFIKRFSAMEEMVLGNNENLRDLSNEEMNKLWERVKLGQN